MQIEILTKEDLDTFRKLLIADLVEVLNKKIQPNKQWLKSNEVRKLLNIAPGTLQLLRNNKTISYTKIGNILYYNNEDIEKLLKNNKVQ